MRVAIPSPYSWNISNAGDTDDVVRESVRDSLHELGKRRPVLVIGEVIEFTVLHRAKHSQTQYCLLIEAHSHVCCIQPLQLRD